ncbi:unnamed protein product [Symbiodinium sp. KB8]|nr:unnamed protein product [Symbiodinium sp. KB8]
MQLVQELDLMLTSVVTHHDQDFRARLSHGRLQILHDKLFQCEECGSLQILLSGHLLPPLLDKECRNLQILFSGHLLPILLDKECQSPCFFLHEDMRCLFHVLKELLFPVPALQQEGSAAVAYCHHQCQSQGMEAGAPPFVAAPARPVDATGPVDADAGKYEEGNPDTSDPAVPDTSGRGAPPMPPAKGPMPAGSKQPPARPKPVFSGETAKKRAKRERFKANKAAKKATAAEGAVDASMVDAAAPDDDGGNDDEGAEPPEAASSSRKPLGQSAQKRLDIRAENRKLNSENVTLMQTILAMRETETELRQKVTDLEAEAQEKMRAHKLELKQLEDKLEAVRKMELKQLEEKLGAAGKTELKDLEARHSKAMERLEEQHSKAMERLEASHKKELAARIEEGERKLKQDRAFYQQQLNVYDRDAQLKLQSAKKDAELLEKKAKLVAQDESNQWKVKAMIAEDQVKLLREGTGAGSSGTGKPKPAGRSQRQTAKVVLWIGGVDNALLCKGCYWPVFHWTGALCLISHTQGVWAAGPSAMDTMEELASICSSKRETFQDLEIDEEVLRWMGIVKSLAARILDAECVLEDARNEHRAAQARLDDMVHDRLLEQRQQLKRKSGGGGEPSNVKKPSSGKASMDKGDAAVRPESERQSNCFMSADADASSSDEQWNAFSFLMSAVQVVLPSDRGAREHTALQL